MNEYCKYVYSVAMKISGLYDVSESEAPALHAALDRLCKKAGIEKPTLTFVDASEFKNPLHRFTFEHMAGALHLDKPRIIIGDKMRVMLDHHNLSTPISEEFEAVLAHEIGHIKYGDVKLHKVIPMRLSPWIGALAGVAGVWFHNHLKEKEAENIRLGKSQAQSDAELQAQWNVSDRLTSLPEEKPQPLLQVIKYIAGGLLGFAAGAAVYSLAHRHIEFRADRTSAELMEDGKPLARALVKLREAFSHGAKDIEPEVLAAYQKQNPVTKLLRQLTHPEDAERIERLNNWSR